MYGNILAWMRGSEMSTIVNLTLLNSVLLTETHREFVLKVRFNQLLWRRIKLPFEQLR